MPTNWLPCPGKTRATLPPNDSTGVCVLALSVSIRHLRERTGRSYHEEYVTQTECRTTPTAANRSARDSVNDLPVQQGRFSRSTNATIRVPHKDNVPPDWTDPCGITRTGINRACRCRCPYCRPQSLELRTPGVSGNDALRGGRGLPMGHTRTRPLCQCRHPRRCRLTAPAGGLPLEFCQCGAENRSAM